jgi:hypothetical protein
MNIGQLKEKYEQFKRWQKQPVDYINSEEEHQCKNCGLTFTGNYCPCCSQKANMGRISWRSVHQGVMDIWGLGTRSLLFSIWQLLWRPGYMISDYINGRRQVSFPPVKMLFILAVIYSFLAYWLFPDVFHIKLDNDDEISWASQYFIWYREHYSWNLLIMAVLAIIPTWVMFRHSPRNNKHTIPEGFFIQVFLSVLSVVISFLVIPFALIHLQLSTAVSSILIMVYYIITYKQLFGYGLWGTLWRQGFIGLCIACIESDLVLVFSNKEFFEPLKELFPGLDTTGIKLFLIVTVLVFAILTLFVGHIINLLATRKVRKQAKLMNK